MLNTHAVKLPSKHLCLCPQICVSLNFGQKCIFSQWEMLNAETHNRVPSVSNCECSATKESCLTPSSHTRLRDTKEGCAYRPQDLKNEEESRGMITSEHGSCNYQLTAPWFYHGWRGASEFPPLAEEKVRLDGGRVTLL